MPQCLYWPVVEASGYPAWTARGGGGSAPRDTYEEYLHMKTLGQFPVIVPAQAMLRTQPSSSQRESHVRQCDHGK